MFNSLSLKRKLFLLEATSFTMFLLMVIFGIMQMHNSKEDGKDNLVRLHADIDAMSHIETMNIAFLKEVKLAKDVWIRGGDPANQKKYRGEFVDQADQFEKNRLSALDILQKSSTDQKGLDDFIARLNTLSGEHQSLSGKYLAQIDAHVSTADSDARVAGIDRPLTKMVTELRNDFSKFVEEKNLEKIKLAQESYEQHRNAMIVLAFVALCLSVFLSKLIVRSVLQQLGGDPQEVAQIIHVIAYGNFTLVPHKAPAEGSLLASTYGMQAQLRSMIETTKNHTHDLIDMAHSFAAAAKQISQSVNHEADSVSSMAAAIEQLSTSSMHISQQGDDAKAIATSSRQSAQDGASIINKTVSGLLTAAQEIESASKDVSHLGDDASRINDVVNVIRDIADQTNLLALNAAIEAARAGEQGRGFAVVADEVRKLAERTSNATTEINQMSANIGDVAKNALNGMAKVVNTTREGVADAESAQSSISNIQHSFGEVSRVIDEISNSLAEQNAASNDLAGNTERIAQMAEENSSAAKSLLELAQDLESKAGQVRSTVEVFKV
jgi:methyl-accepting chemotaxis protein